jgi:nicotinamidase-related amidase
MPLDPLAGPVPPLTLERSRSVLVLVDYQARLMPAIHGGAAAVDEALFLAATARCLGVPVLGTEQNPAGLGPNDGRIAAACDQTLAKTHFDATADGLLDAVAQRRPGASQVVVGGCEAHVCLLQTALGLVRAGLQVFVVPAACGSRRAADHALAMQRLQAAGVTALAPEMVAFEWLRACTDPQFKAVLALVKARPAG